MDSSGDAAISIVEFVSFIIVTKQVQIKLRLEGVIDAGSLNDATRPHQRDNRRGKGRVPPHPNLTVLTGHESTGPVDDLSVCISHAATRCGFEAIEFERWLGGRFLAWRKVNSRSMGRNNSPQNGGRPTRNRSMQALRICPISEWKFYLRRGACIALKHRLCFASTKFKTPEAAVEG